MEQESKMNNKKEKLVENFIKKLINHISTKASEAASYGDNNDSCFGMDGWRTEEELADSIREIFEINTNKEDEDNGE